MKLFARDHYDHQAALENASLAPKPPQQDWTQHQVDWCLRGVTAAGYDVDPLAEGILRDRIATVVKRALGVEL